MPNCPEIVIQIQALVGLASGKLKYPSGKRKNQYMCLDGNSFTNLIGFTTARAGAAGTVGIKRL